MKTNRVKTSILLLVMLNIFTPINGQEPLLEDVFYTKHLNNFNGTNGPWKVYEKLDNTDGFIESKGWIMQGYMQMIRHESNIVRVNEYIKTQIKMMSYLLDIRDKNTAVEDYWGRSFYWWAKCVDINDDDDFDCNSNAPANNIVNSTAMEVDKKYCSPIVTGKVTYPMADLAEFILNPSTGSLYQNEVFQADAISPTYDGKTYSYIANDLLDRVDESINEHIKAGQFVTTMTKDNGNPFTIPVGSFIHQPKESNDDDFGLIDNEGIAHRQCLEHHLIPYNMHSAIGSAILMTYQAMSLVNHVKTSTYLDRSQRMANYLRYHMRKHPGVASYYLWGYGDWESYNSSNCRSTTPDDYGHAYLTAQFPILCYNYNLNISNSISVPVFNTSDMQRITNGLSKFYYGEPRQFWTHFAEQGTSPLTTYNGNSLKEKTYDNCSSSAVYQDHFAYIFSHSSPYVSWNKSLFHIMLDGLTVEALEGSLSSANLLRIALLAKYGKENGFKFRPKAVTRTFGKDSYWGAVASGDLDGDNQHNDMVTIRNGNDKAIHISKYEKGCHAYNDFNCDSSNKGWECRRVNLKHVTSLKNFDQNTNCSNNMDWRGVAVGNFDDSDSKDEIALIRYTSQGYEHLFLYKLVGTNLVEIAKYGNCAAQIGYGSGSEWIAVRKVDVNHDGIHEFAALRKNDGHLVLFSYNSTSNQIEKISASSYTTNITNWSDLVSLDSDGNGIDELVGVTTGGLMYSLPYTLNTSNPLAVNFTSPQLIQLVESGNNINGQVAFRKLATGDYNLDGLDNEIVSYEWDLVAGKKENGLFRIFELEDLTAQQVHQEEMHVSFFSRAIALGSIYLKESCKKNSLIVLRNSNVDADQFIFDLGLPYEGVPSEDCFTQVDLKGDPSKESTNGSSSTNSDQLMSISVSPNPNNGNFQLSITTLNSETSLFKISIYDLFGGLIQNIRTDQTIINFDNLESGTYVIKVQNLADNSMLTKKLIVTT